MSTAIVAFLAGFYGILTGFYFMWMIISDETPWKCILWPYFMIRDLLVRGSTK